VPSTRDPSLNALAPSALARDGEYRALAALVAANTLSSNEAVRALAGAAGKDTALQWLLVLDLTEAQWAEVTSSLPAKVPLSGKTEALVARLVPAALAAPESSRAAAVAKFVAATTDPLRRLNLARRIARNAPATGLLHDAAFKVLAAESEPKDRLLLLKDATRPDAGLPDRIVRMDSLGELTKPAEERAAKSALTELVAYPAQVDTAALGRIASRLDVKWLANWFYSAWPYGLALVATDDFGLALGWERLVALIRDAMTAEQILGVYTAAFGLDWEGDASVAVRLVEAGHALPDGAARYLKDGASAAVRDVAWQILLADTTGLLVPAYAEAATFETVARAAEAHFAHPDVVARLADVATQMSVRLSRQDPTLARRIPEPDWTSMVIAVTATLGQLFLRTLAPQFQSLVAPPEILDLVLLDDETVIAFVHEGAAAEVVAHANQPADATRLLTLCGHILGRDHVEALLDTVGVSDPAMWSDALTSAAQRHPDLVLDRARDLVDALGDPVQASRPNPRVVAIAVRVALANGLAADTAENALGRVAVLLSAHRHADLVEVGCEWATGLSPDDADLGAVVKAAVEADDRRATKHTALTALRAYLSDVFIRTARDTSRPTNDRADALRLAAEADLDRAYTAAIELAGNDDPDLNLAAAHVLNLSTVQAWDIPRVQTVFDAETDAAARDLYGQALTRVHAKAAQDALHRLLDLTGETATTALIAAVAPHDHTEDADRLVHAANEVLQTNSPASQPTAFVTAASSLVDELMYAAIVATADAGDPIKSVDTDRIRVRDESSPGGIAARQPVQERLPWAAQVLGLHNIRQAHATKKGQTRPTPLTEKDRSNARTLLGMVLTGWLHTMHGLKK